MKEHGFTNHPARGANRPQEGGAGDRSALLLHKAWIGVAKLDDEAAPTNARPTVVRPGREMWFVCDSTRGEPPQALRR
jgi:hypothetical protein